MEEDDIRRLYKKFLQLVEVRRENCQEHFLSKRRQYVQQTQELISKIENDQETALAQREADDQARIKEQIRVIREKDKNIPKDPTKFFAYLIRKTRATEGLDRRQNDLIAENKQLEMNVKSQAGEIEITHGLLLHEQRIEEELRAKLKKLKAKLAAGPT